LRDQLKIAEATFSSRSPEEIFESKSCAKAFAPGQRDDAILSTILSMMPVGEFLLTISASMISKQCLLTLMATLTHP